MRCTPKDGGAFPDAIRDLTWAYNQPFSPSPEEVLREINGKALADVLDPKDPTKVLVKAGDQLPSFAMLRDDGSTSCGNWIYCGTWSQAGNNTARRDNSDPSGLGQTLNWGYAWPENRRIIYNRASADLQGKPWDASRTVLKWTAANWGGNDIPDMRPDAKPEEGVMPFIMTPEGVGRLFTRELMADGPFPEHYEPFESPIDSNPMHAEGQVEPGGPRLQRATWKPSATPRTTVRRDDLPPDGALPLLDEVLEGERHRATGAVRRDRRGWRRRRASRPATGSRCAPTAATSRPWRWSPSASSRSRWTARRSTPSASRFTGVSRGRRSLASSPTP